MEENILDTPEFQQQSYADATTGKRFTNYIIDLISFYFLVLALYFFRGFILAILGMIYYPLKGLNAYLLSITIMLLYYIVMESVFGQTVGKLITKTKVVSEDGSKPGFKTILLRTLCRMIPFEAFSFLGGNRGWHDTITKTRVVNK